MNSRSRNIRDWPCHMARPFSLSFHHFSQPNPNGMHHIDRNAVSRLLIYLSVWVYGQGAVNLRFIKSLQAQAFSRRQPANPSATYRSLAPCRRQCMGKTFAYMSPPIWVAAVHAVSFTGRQISCSGVVPDRKWVRSSGLLLHHSGQFSFAVAHPWFCIVSRQTPAGLRNFRFPYRHVHKDGVLPLVPVQSPVIRGIERICLFNLPGNPFISADSNGI